jgi:predicted nucleotidyltransferase
MGMLLRPLDRIFGSQSKVALLRVLSRTTGPVSAREAARLAGIAHSGARRALEELTQMGVVDRAETAIQHLYTISAAHELVVQGVAPLFNLEQERVAAVFGYVRELLWRELAAKTVRNVTIFGSAARGEDTPGSDLDLLVVTAAADQVAAVHERLVDASMEVFRRFGLSLSPVVLAFDQLVRQAEDGDPFVGDVIRDGRHVAGEAVEGLLRQRPQERA